MKENTVLHILKAEKKHFYNKPERIIRLVFYNITFRKYETTYKYVRDYQIIRTKKYLLVGIYFCLNITYIVLMFK